MKCSDCALFRRFERKPNEHWGYCDLGTDKDGRSLPQWVGGPTRLARPNEGCDFGIAKDPAPTTGDPT